MHFTAPINWTFNLSDDDEEVLRISQSSSITGASPSNYLVLYPGHSSGESYPSTEIQLVYSAAPANWAIYSLYFK